MQGLVTGPGVVQRALLGLFSATSDYEACLAADISMAMLETYNKDAAQSAGR